MTKSFIFECALIGALTTLVGILAMPILRGTPAASAGTPTLELGVPRTFVCAGTVNGQSYTMYLVGPGADEVGTFTDYSICEGIDYLYGGPPPRITVREGEATQLP